MIFWYFFSSNLSGRHANREVPRTDLSKYQLILCVFNFWFITVFWKYQKLLFWRENTNLTMAATPRGSLTVINCFPDSTFLSLEHFTKLIWKHFKKQNPIKPILTMLRFRELLVYIPYMVTPPFQHPSNMAFVLYQKQNRNQHCRFVLFSPCLQVLITFDLFWCKFSSIGDVTLWDCKLNIYIKFLESVINLILRGKYFELQPGVILHFW